MLGFSISIWDKNWSFWDPKNEKFGTSTQVWDKGWEKVEIMVVINVVKEKVGTWVGQRW